MASFGRMFKYFVYGLVFHAVIFAISFSGYNSLSQSFFFAVAIAVTLWVGLTTEGVLGVSFGTSYFLVSLIGSLALYAHYFQYGYLYWPFGLNLRRVLWSVFLLDAIVLAIYGYIPARYYSNGKTGRALVGGFFISLFLDIVVSFPLMLDFAMIPIVFRLILGGLSAWLGYRHLKTRLQPTKPVTYPPMPLPTQTIRCNKCGFDNSPTSNYCGRCGTPLKEETVYY
jgi:hypothetical protein